MPGWQDSIDLVIIVAGGVGSTTFDRKAKVTRAAFKAPTNAVYAMEFIDVDTYGIDRWDGLNGDATIKMEEVCNNCPTTVQITGTDGTYSLRLLISYEI